MQRRHHQIGRIRIGEKVATKTGKARPAKLETFRLTSSDRRAIDAAAALYGGEARPWAEQEGQWEVVTETPELAIAIPPNGELSQWYESWTGGGCTRRCDGQWEQIGDTACVCDPQERECKPHTRLSVVLTDLPGVGMWRLDTQGWYAATELGGTINLLAAAADRGTFLPARLRLEQRQVKRPGQQTRKFAVPVVDLDVPLLQVPALVSGARGAIGPAEVVTGEIPQRTGLTPVPEVLQGPTVAEQVAAAEDPPSRSRASTPKLPASGRRPRPVADASGESEQPFRPTVATADDDPGPTDDGANGPMPFPQKFAMTAREAGIDHHLIVEAVTSGDVKSSRELPLADQGAAWAALTGVTDGSLILEHDDAHRWTVRVRDEQDDPCPASLFAELEESLRGLTVEQKKQLGSVVRNRVVRMRLESTDPNDPGDVNPRYSHRHHMRTCDALEALGFDAPAVDAEAV